MGFSAGGKAQLKGRGKMALTDSEQHPFYGADLKCSFSKVHLRAVAWPESWQGNETVFSLAWITAQAILRLAKSPARVYVNVSPSLKKQRRKKKNVECRVLCVCVLIVFLIQDMSTVFGRMTKWQTVTENHVLV